MENLQTILSDLEKSVQCAICLDVLKNPVTTRCDHNFCNLCIRQALKGKVELPCPLCKKVIRQRSLRKAVHLCSIISAVQNVTNQVQDDAGLPYTLSQSTRENAVNSDLAPLNEQDSEPCMLPNSQTNGASTSKDSNSRIPSPVLSVSKSLSSVDHPSNKMDDVSTKSAKSFVGVQFSNSMKALENQKEETPLLPFEIRGEGSLANGQRVDDLCLGKEQRSPTLRGGNFQNQHQESQIMSTNTTESSLTPNTPTLVVSVDVHPPPSTSSISSSLNGEIGEVEGAVDKISYPHVESVQKEGVITRADMQIDCIPENHPKPVLDDQSNMQNNNYTLEEQKNDSNVNENMQIAENKEGEDPFAFPVSQPQRNVKKPAKRRSNKGASRTNGAKVIKPKPGVKRKTSDKTPPPGDGRPKRKSKKSSPQPEKQDLESMRREFSEVESHSLVVTQVPERISRKSKSGKLEQCADSTVTHTDIAKKTCGTKMKKPTPKKTKSPRVKKCSENDEIQKITSETPHLARRLLSASSSSSDSFKNEKVDQKLLPLCEPLVQQSVTDKVNSWLENSETGDIDSSPISHGKTGKNDSMSEDDLISHSQQSIEQLSDRVIVLK